MGFVHFNKNLGSFYPDFRKTVIILSDGLEEYDNVVEGNIIYKTYHIDHFPWPIIALFKMKYIYDHRIDCDYVCYFNGNLQYNLNYDTSLNKIDLSKLNVSRHVGSNPNSEYDNKLFTNIDQKSQAYIEHNYKYIHSGLFIGPSNIVYEMCKDVYNMCEIDLMKNIIPRYHDESYLNKWVQLNLDKVAPPIKLISYKKFEKDKPFAVIETIKKYRTTK